MIRASLVLTAVALLLFAAQGCSTMVQLEAGHYPPMLDTGDVRVIDARGMGREQIENILNEHSVIGRFDVMIPRNEDLEPRLTEEVEKGKPKALAAGGNVLMYTDDSEMVAVIMRNARYAGAPNAITMYVLLPHR